MLKMGVRLQKKKLFKKMMYPPPKQQQIQFKNMQKGAC